MLVLLARHFGALMPSPGSNPATQLAAQLAALRQPLLRFAQLQLRNESLAEDAVSETMLAILEAPARFEGRSSLRTYATGVLKFKIIDVLRRRGRKVELATDEDQTLDEAIEALYGRDGHYVDKPQAWDQPEAALEQAQFMAAERTRLRLHLAVCTACRNVEQQFDFIRRAMKRLGKDDGQGG